MQTHGQRDGSPQRAYRGPAPQQRLARAAGQQEGQQQRRHANQHDRTGHDRGGKAVPRRGDRQRQTHKETGQHQQDTTEDGCAEARRLLPVTDQVQQPEPEVQALALAEQHGFVVELIDGPANGQQAAAQCHSGHGQQINECLAVTTLH